MPAYYNEIDQNTAAWLRVLISEGHIAPGDVDTRSIEDVCPDDLRPYTQCHFFAGVGVWSYALRAAGWPDERPVWTGSCPCQPFSKAGKGEGFADERHLWPALYHLIGECRPVEFFGEQVTSKAGCEWLDLVQADMEAKAYAVAPFDLPAASAGAYHIRQRHWFVAHTHGQRRSEQRLPDRAPGRENFEALGDGEAGLMVNTGLARSPARQQTELQRAYWPLDGRTTEQSGRPSRAVEWIPCRDGKWRPIEPGTFPLAHAPPSRVGRLRGYGNAIDAEIATEFISAYLDLFPNSI